ncbi:hypothetical protein KFU94_48335 [Chloroflexi bacterium TSY]|nr:hypothetical protein [Chloroflexi bacterium TSY]
MTDGWIAIEGDEGLGPPVTLAFQHQDLSTLFQEIALLSHQRGVPLYFHIEQIDHFGGAPFLQFNTQVGQIGNDLTQTTGGAAAVVLTPENETLVEYELIYDWRETLNRAYVGYGISTNAGEFVTVEDPDLAAYLTTNPLGLREGFRNTGELEDFAAELPGEADIFFRETMHQPQVDGRLGETDTFCYICDWRWGDRVTVAADCLVFDACIETLELTLNEGPNHVWSSR